MIFIYRMVAAISLGLALDRLPLSPGLIYLLTGVALGPAGLNITALSS
jgi:Kef-type K+ transport system membrane component KefB